MNPVLYIDYRGGEEKELCDEENVGFSRGERAKVAPICKRKTHPN